MFITVNNDVHEVTDSPRYFKGRTGPDVWACGPEVELFWAYGRPKVNFDMLVRLHVEGHEPITLRLPRKRTFARRFGGPPLVARPDWNLNYGPARLDYELGDEAHDSEDRRILPAVGPWRPWGPIAPDSPGGSGIDHGYRKTEPEFVYDAHLGCMDRAWVYYRYEDGEPLLPIKGLDYDGSGSSEPNGELPEYRDIPKNDGLPKPYDWAHYIRQIRYGIAANAQCPTPMVERHLRALAHHAVMAFSHRGPVIDGPGYTARNIVTYRRMAQKSPHTGIPGTWMGRQMGWCAWAVRAAQPDFWLDSWYFDARHLCAQAAMPTGFIQRNGFDGIDAERHGAWNNTGMDGAQVFEWCLLACAFANGDLTPDWIKRGIRQINALPRLSYAGHESWSHFVDVAHRDGKPLTRLRPVGNEPDPAPWHLDTLLRIVAG